MSLIAQIWGKNPDNFYKTARELTDGTFARELGLPEGLNFSGIDLNMGCPDKTVVKNGACSALVNDRELARQHELDGIMVGLGVFQDPFVFADTWRDGERPVALLNKFCKIHINGFDGAKDYRDQLMEARIIQALLVCLEQASGTKSRA
jgi:tRNA-dihydrouridine synthase